MNKKITIQFYRKMQRLKISNNLLQNSRNKSQLDTLNKCQLLKANNLSINKKKQHKNRSQIHFWKRLAIVKMSRNHQLLALQSYMNPQLLLIQSNQSRLFRNLYSEMCLTINAPLHNSNSNPNQAKHHSKAPSWRNLHKILLMFNHHLAAKLHMRVDLQSVKYYPPKNKRNLKRRNRFQKDRKK